MSHVAQRATLAQAPESLEGLGSADGAQPKTGSWRPDRTNPSPRGAAAPTLYSPMDASPVAPRAAAQLTVLLLCLAACSCTEEPPREAKRRRERTSLIEHARFALTDAAGDPFDDRPATPAVCQEWAYLAEDSGGSRVFSIQTAGCPYATFMQPTLVDVYEGEFLDARLWHFRLTALDPAEAHVAVALGAEGLGVDTRLPMPSDSGVLGNTWRAPRDYPAGTPVYFHVHNHGDNEYQLIELSTGSDDPNAATTK